MREEATVAVITKTVTTGAAAWMFLGVTPWAWVAAFIGATLSYYFEPEHTPKTAAKMLFGIFAMGFAAALLAAASPHIPWFGIGEFAGKVSLEVRAGLLGLSIRWIFAALKLLASLRAGVVTR